MMASFPIIFLLVFFIVSTSTLTSGFSASASAFARRKWQSLEKAVYWSSASSMLSDTKASDLNVYVYDNTFPAAACEDIHDLTLDHNTRGNDGSSIFFRPPHNESALSPLENIIHGALTALDDTTKTVEYWSREEYMNIDTHADIDEVELEDEGTLRCPEMAHVLYLKVKDGLRGPTCVFPNKLTGWGQVNNKEGKVDLVTVPAVQGRILRFTGSAMHAVPRPANRWLLSEQEEKGIRLQEKNEAYELEAFDDDKEDLDENYENFEIERSVLLFNTWSDDGPPPRGINRDYATGALPDGIELDENTDIHITASLEAQRMIEWEEYFGVDAEQICYNPRSDWQEVAVISAEHDTPEKEATRNVRVNLMGKQLRRVHPKATALLGGPIEELLSALEERTRVTFFEFSEKIANKDKP